MEQVTANLSGKRRSVKQHGHEFIVAPITLIVPGVLNGSKGPLYYPSEEIERSAQSWNGMPLVSRHPDAGLSARSPEAFKDLGIGTVFNAVWKDGKLVAEGWFDVDQTARVDQRILAALRADKPIEISTGLLTDNETASEGAEFEGKSYSHIARNYRPDHLAILPDQTGACSLQDGCGVLNEGNTIKGNTFTYAVTDGSEWVIGPKMIETIKKESAMDETQKKALIDSLITNSCCWEEEDRETLNALEDDKLKHLQAQAAKDQEQLVMNKSARKEFTDTGGNTHTFDEKSKAWGSKMKETKAVENAEAKKKAEEQAAVANKALNEYKAEVAPQLAFAQNEMTRQKAELADRLVENVADNAAKVAHRERLMTRSLEDLRQDVSLLPQRIETPAAASYAGAAGSAQPIATNEAQQDSFAEFGLPSEYIPGDKD